MSMLAFFPWLRFQKRLTFATGRYQIVPFRREAEPGGQGTALQATFDALLKRYVQGKSHHVPQATLVQLGAHNLTDDLTDEEIDELFLFVKCFTFAALAARRFFRLQNDYTNADSCVFYIQRFIDPTAGFTYAINRIDYTTGVYSPKDVYAQRHPFHVVPDEPPLDAVLLEALLLAATSTDWARYDDALFSFNAGNTDNDATPIQARLVHVVGAIEQVLECRSGNDNELVAAFIGKWRTTRQLAPPHTIRDLRGRDTRKDGSAVPVIEVWLRDLYTFRGNLSHGRQRTRHPEVWTLREHLLLAAYAFPLLVKLVLAAGGLYTLNDREQDEIAVFEHLVSAADICGQPANSRHNMDFTWNHVYGDAMNYLSFERSFQRAIEIHKDDLTDLSATDE